MSFTIIDLVFLQKISLFPHIPTSHTCTWARTHATRHSLAHICTHTHTRTKTREHTCLESCVSSSKEAKSFQVLICFIPSLVLFLFLFLLIEKISVLARPCLSLKKFRLSAHISDVTCLHTLDSQFCSWRERKREKERVRVCVCVWERERESEKDMWWRVDTYGDGDDCKAL